MHLIEIKEPARGRMHYPVRLMSFLRENRCVRRYSGRREGPWRCGSVRPPSPTSAQMHLEHPGKFWNTAELGSLLVKRLRADSKKQHVAIPKIKQSSRRPHRISATTPRFTPAAECGDAVRHRIPSNRAPLSGGFDDKSRCDVRRRPGCPASNAHCADTLAYGHLILLADGCRCYANADKSRVEVAEYPSGRHARSGRRDRTA